MRNRIIKILKSVCNHEGVTRCVNRMEDALIEANFSDEAERVKLDVELETSKQLRADLERETKEREILENALRIVASFERSDIHLGNLVEFALRKAEEEFEDGRKEQGNITAKRVYPVKSRTVSCDKCKWKGSDYMKSPCKDCCAEVYEDGTTGAGTHFAWEDEE
jgi:hypothetical protein